MMLSLFKEKENIRDVDIFWTALDKHKEYSPTDIINMEKFSDYK